MLTIDNIAAFLTSLAAFLVAFASIATAIISSVNTKRNIESWTNSQQADIDTHKREQIIQMRALLAICNALKSGIVNGEVDKSIVEINEFLLKESHRGVSHA